MEIGCCPSCARPFTSSEVVGLGILRTRPESQGGPYVEYSCPSCERRMVLVPHGQGRYAFPGTPPPPPVPDAERRPSWVTAPPARKPEPAAPASSQPPHQGSPPPRPSAPPPWSPPPSIPREDEAVTLSEALQLLGIPPTASREEIDGAFRVRSLQCHPDKVAHLDPDLQALADRKFRRLLSAYEMLTR
jgi:hypothetical protein